MTGLERRVLRRLADALRGQEQLERRLVLLEAKVARLEQPASDYGPPELLARLEGVRARLQAIR